MTVPPADSAADRDADRDADPGTDLAADPAAELMRERVAHFAAQAALFLREHALSIASHDLRSPLNAIHSWAYVLEHQLASADPQLQRALAGIRAGIDQQTKLIDAVLDAPRAETRTLALAKRPFALRPLLDDAIALARHALADARRVAIDATLPADAQPFVGDRERLAQAVWSMLIVATEASAAGARVSFACALEDTQLVVRAAFAVDANALVDAARPHVLETFARSEMLSDREARRHAWALALGQRVAAAHGGALAHEPFVDGAPATITLTIPDGAPM